MASFISLLIGIFVLALGFPIGNYLAKETKEELKDGQLWFKLIIIASMIGIVFGLGLRNDALFFTFSFIAIVTGRSLKVKKK